MPRPKITRKVVGAIDGSFTPSDIANLQLWLDADAFDTIIKDGSDKVSQWNDKSGNTNNAVQATGADQPTWIDNVVNNKPSLDFDGSTDMMLVSSFDGFMSGDDEISTVFVVFQHDVTSLDYIWAFGKGTSDNPVYGGRITNSDKYEIVKRDDIGTVKSVLGTTTISTATTYIATQIIDVGGLTADTHINGDADVIDGDIDVGTTTIDELGIGALPLAVPILFWDGKISEIIIYNRTLSATEFAAIENYLSTKWGIVLS